MTRRGDPKAQARMNQELHALIETVAGQLDTTTVALAHELVDANEAPIAVDMVSEMLVEARARVSPAVLREFEAICPGLGLTSLTADRLRALVPLAQSTIYRCPVCGYGKLTEPPRSLGTGGASYEICPSCGFQFGVSDEDRGYTYQSWRDEWVRRGMPWSSSGQAPADWNPTMQLKALLGT